MGGRRSEEVRTGRSEACGAPAEETEWLQHAGIIWDVICNSNTQSALWKKACHHELIAPNSTVVMLQLLSFMVWSGNNNHTPTTTQSRSRVGHSCDWIWDYKYLSENDPDIFTVFRCSFHHIYWTEEQKAARFPILLQGETNYTCLLLMVYETESVLPSLCALTNQPTRPVM